MGSAKRHIAVYQDDSKFLKSVSFPRLKVDDSRYRDIASKQDQTNRVNFT